MRTYRTATIAMLSVVGLVLAACSDDATDADPTTSAAAPETSGAAAPPSTPDTTEGGASTSSPESTAPPTTTGGLLDAPVSPVPPLFDEADVMNAVDQIDDVVGEVMDETGVPGVAVGVVYEDEVILAEGFGVRRVGEPETVDPDTVFQVASVSKPVASTIVAGVVGQGRATWTDPVATWNPDFALSDPYVTTNATLSDLLSHRSGLATSAGDLLEDLGWDREYILGVLDQQPLDAFRANYHYSNFGITEAGVAAADAMGTTWEDLADSMLFQPLGMDSSSYRHADFLARDNKAVIHVPAGSPTDKVWEPRYADVRNADAEAPAGGLSSSVNDLTQFLRLQLGHGTVEGTEHVEAAALEETHFPHQEITLPTPAVRAQFYGLGWNVTYDDQGRVRLDHSGAFALGAATNVMLIEGEQLGIVTLTNGRPTGAPEAINQAFFDIAQNGRQTVDWLGLFGGVYTNMFESMEQVDAQWVTPPAAPAPPPDEAALLGTYQNSYYGPLTVTSDGGALTMTMGPPAAPTNFVLTHFDGVAYTFDTIGENAAGKSGATFTLGPDGVATSVVLAFYDQTGLGTFTR